MNLIAGKTYRWKYKPEGSRTIVETVGRFTGEFNDLNNMPRMVQDIYFGDGKCVQGFILADPDALEEVEE